MIRETPITPLSKKELAAAYGRSYYTINKWLVPHTKDIGPYTGGAYTPNQVAMIIGILGPPPNIFRETPLKRPENGQ